MPYRPRRVAVTGAAGFVGLNLVERLLAAGLAVTGVDLTPPPEAALSDFAALPGRLDQVVASTSDFEAMARAFEGADAVVHGAAVTAGPDRERSHARRIVDVNLGGTQTVLDAVAATRSVHRFIQVSSGAVYGESAFGSEPVDEATTPAPVGLYGITKLGSELLALRHAVVHETSVIVARLSAVFGPWERDTGVRDSLSPMYRIALAAGQGDSLAAEDWQPRNWLYSRDAAIALAGLVETSSPRYDLYNVTPTEWFEPTAWARHLGFQFLPSPAHAIPPTAAGIPHRQRAPVANRRIRDELAGWPRFSPDRAFEDYSTWLADHTA